MKKSHLYNVVLSLIFGLCALGLFSIQVYSAAPQGHQQAETNANVHTPSEVVRVAMIEFNSTVEFTNRIDGTLTAIRKALAPREVVFQVFDSETLEKKIHSGDVDFFIASSGFFWRNIPYGARSIATQFNEHLPDPNHSAGIAYVVTRTSTYQDIRELRGKRLIASYPTAFYGYRIGLAEIALSLDTDPYTFFQSTQFVGNPHLYSILERLNAGQADVAFLPACALEALPEKLSQDFRVINAQSTQALQCQVSTRTYPGHTLAVLNGVDPELARQVARTVLSLKTEGTSEAWSIATDFTAVDTLYRVLKIGPYAYLNNTSFRDWVNGNKVWLSALLLIMAGVVAHSIRANQLVEEKTEELQNTIQKERALEAKYRAVNTAMEKLQKANTVSMLSSMITHELAQPLSSLRHYLDAQNILLKAERPNRELLSKSRERLLEQTERAISIVNKVRQYGRSKGHNEKVVDVVPILSKLIGWLRVEGIDFLAHSPLPKSLTTHGDELELELALWNLVKNARDAALEATHPTLSIDTKATTEHIVITITNSGVLLTTKAIDDMRTPLTSKKKDGLGLGLPIVESILELTGGRLSLTPNPTGGLTAQVTLPRWNSSEGVDHA